jgi:hypothetical protein
MFTFGQTFGAAKAVLTLSCSLVTILEPRAWQKALFGKGSGDTKADSLGFAKERFPHAEREIGRNHGISDAVCIAVRGWMEEDEIQ